LEKEYLRIDLVILGYYQRFHTIDWKRLDWSSKAACGFRAEAMEYWVSNQGFSIPMTGRTGNTRCSWRHIIALMRIGKPSKMSAAAS